MNWSFEGRVSGPFPADARPHVEVGEERVMVFSNLCTILRFMFRPVLCCDEFALP